MADTPSRKVPASLLAIVPIAIIAALAFVLLKVGTAGIFPGNFPPVEDLSFNRVTLEPDSIEVSVTNGGPSPIDIAQVLVDDAFWAYQISPSAHVERLGSATIELQYPWVEGEPVIIKILTASGVTFEHEIAVATSTPRLGMRFLGTFTLLGLYIGLLPILLGMTFLPLIKRVNERWLHFFMAFTVGVLVFLGAETLVEAIERSEELPSAFGGIGAVVVGAVGSFALILAFSRWMKGRASSDAKLVVAFMVAFGIGMHNLGEGLAVGAAYRLGEIALGTFLVIGFALHNTTEGIGIVAILGRRRTSLLMLFALGAVAGLPTIAGAWLGAFFFSPTIAVIFLAIATGAIAEVVFDVASVIKEDSPRGLTSMESLAGLASGVALMYATGILIAA